MNIAGRGVGLCIVVPLVVLKQITSTLIIDT